MLATARKVKRKAASQFLAISHTLVDKNGSVIAALKPPLPIGMPFFKSSVRLDILDSGICPRFGQQKPLNNTL